MEHGKSISQELPMGSRRKAFGIDGKIHTLAPKHFRKLGKNLMEEVTNEEIAFVYFGADLNGMRKSISSHKGLVTKATKNDDEEEAERQETLIAMSEKEIESILEKVRAFREA